MSIIVSITSNAKELAKKFDRDVEHIKRFLSEAVMKATFLVERGAKIKSPVDTGRLRSSIQTEIRPLTATIFPTVNYAIYVHDGTRFMAGRPFMRNALSEAESNIQELFTKAIHDALQ